MMSETIHETLPFSTPFIAATLIFLVTYAIIASEKINRAVIALLGAGLVIILGILTQAQAIAAIDFNTLGLLMGMMVIVHITSKTGIFEYLSIWSVKKVEARPWGILVMISLITAVASAMLDNVTTVLLITPVMLSIARELEVNPYPYLFSIIFFSNIGGTATLIGDPPNIMIGSALNFTFNDFIVHTAPAALIVMLATFVPIYFIWGRSMTATYTAQSRVLAMKERECIKDTLLLKHSLFVMTLVMIGFVMAHHFHLESATIAMTGAALLLFLENLAHSQEKHHENVHAAFAEAEWVTIFFFVGLFIIVGAIEHVGLINLLAEEMLALTGGDFNKTTMAVLWVSAIASAFVDNIPFVATMIPMIKSMAASFGGHDALMPLWWALSLGACFGGNGTLIGASANLVVAGFAEKAGHRISFLKFLKHALPLMLLSILISTVYIYWRYL